MRAFGAIIIVTFALVQMGCASLDQGECLTGDWSRIGYEDGAAGHPPSRLSDHAQACAAYGVRPDSKRYMTARAHGLEAYCTPPHGFKEGRMGRKYHGVCPPRLVRGFLAGYDDGLRVHAANEHRDEIRNDVRRFDRRIDNIQDELDDIRDRLEDGRLDASTRDSLNDMRRDLRRELRSVAGMRERARISERAASDHADRLRFDLSRRYSGW